MDKVTRHIQATRTWTASAVMTPVDLPREGLITEVKVRFTPTVTGTGTIGEDGIYRCCQNLAIRGDGGRTYLGLSGEETSRILSFLNFYDFGAPMTDLQGTSVTTNTTPNVTWVFHPGSNPKDPFDMSAVIPASALSTLQVLIQATANAAIAGDTITAGTYSFEINEVLGAPVQAGQMTPLGSTYSWANDANYSDYGYKIDVPAGAWLRRICILIDDNTTPYPLRAEDQIAGVKLELPRTGQIVIESAYDDLIATTGMNSAGAMGTPFQVALTTTADLPVCSAFMKGWIVIDLRKYFNPIWGMNLTNYQTGDVKLGLTVTNRTGGDDTIIYWDQLKPVEPEYVGR